MRFMACYVVAVLLCPGQQPTQDLSGTIRIWGDPNMSAVAKYWAEGFRKVHPGIKFDIQLYGTDTAMASLYTGVADLALMGREPTPTESGAFLHLLNYTPLRFEIMTGSQNVPGKSNALSVYVQKDNPISKLTVAQLDAVFGCEHLRGSTNVRTWGELGLTGPWKDRPVNLYSYDAETGTGLFFLHAALADSRKMNWEHLREFRDIKNPDGSVYEAGQQIVDALQNDPYGLAISGARYPPPQVKPVALASEAGAPYYLATRENLIARKYPLGRTTSALVNRRPDQPLDANVANFLRYVLSDAGQQDIVREGDYLRLNPEILSEQLKKLEQASRLPSR